MIRGFVEGAIAAICFLYAMQTRIMYPSWTLHSLDHPWVLFIGIVLAFALGQWSPKSCVLTLLIIFAFVADIYVFSRHPIKPKPAIKDYHCDAEVTDLNAPNVSGLWGVDDGKWWEANGDVSVREDDSGIFGGRGRGQGWGPPSAVIALVEPAYPTFYGLDKFPPGPSPF